MKWPDVVRTSLSNCFPPTITRPGGLLSPLVLPLQALVKKDKYCTIFLPATHEWIKSKCVWVVGHCHCFQFSKTHPEHCSDHHLEWMKLNNSTMYTQFS